MDRWLRRGAVGALTAAGAAQLAACGPDLDRVVEEAVAAGFQGVLHVEQGGEGLLLEAWGEAIEARDGAGAVAHTPDTVFDIGSLTKQFTAAAVLEASDRGLLSLDDTLAEHLDGVPADRAAVTLHQLLTHTAGLPESVGPDE